LLRLTVIFSYFKVGVKNQEFFKYKTCQSSGQVKRKTGEKYSKAQQYILQLS
jgi:hypothetical protein